MNPATKIKIPPYLRVAIILTLVNLAILVIRNLYVGERFFDFLQSNLFIGSFPTIIIAWLIDMYYKKMGRLLFWFAVALWVLFYPNAPYMISDLIHNSQSPADPEESRFNKVRYPHHLFFRHAFCIYRFPFVESDL